MAQRLLVVLLLTTLNTFAATSEAIFAGGRFWFMQADFDALPGVLSTLVGYDGGKAGKPGDKPVFTDQTPYIEVVKVIFDPNQLSYQQLLNYFWLHIDPTNKNGQFCDKGSRYRSAIFYLNDEQKRTATASKRELSRLLPVVYTTIMPTTQFYAAGDDQQNYYKKNPLYYKYYRWHCGRDKRIKTVWQHVTF